jgi:hypothetical protein
VTGAAVSVLSPWRIRGSYFESCNCEAICPCRMVGGIKGGRSTYGVCFGVLSWLIEDGHAGEIDLSGLAAAFVIRYDDDEPGSPWSFVVHVDERGSEEQRELIDVRASPIEITDGPAGHELRVGRVIELTASRPFETDEVVACGIPGYDNPGTELLADMLVVADDPFAWELSGNCAFASPFDYSS